MHSDIQSKSSVSQKSEPNKPCRYPSIGPKIILFPTHDPAFRSPFAFEMRKLSSLLVLTRKLRRDGVFLTFHGSVLTLGPSLPTVNRKESPATLSKNQTLHSPTESTESSKCSHILNTVSTFVNLRIVTLDASSKVAKFVRLRNYLLSSRETNFDLFLVVSENT